MKKAYWLWHWGDYEIYHTYIMSARRQEFGADYPTMWHNDAPYPTVGFFYSFTSDRDGYARLLTNGKGYIVIDGVRHPAGREIAVPAGAHSVYLLVTKDGGLPCAYVDSDVCPSGDGWLCSHMTADRFPAGWSASYNSPEVTPESFPFAYETLEPVSSDALNGGFLYDFGRETFGFADISGMHAGQTYGVFYGESREEALAGEEAILFEYVSGKTETRLRQRAFRYIFIAGADEGTKLQAQYEYLPLQARGSFRCDNELFNRVWQMCAYTFHLNCRETYLDGIKRDRWPWSGDAYQSYSINRYLFADRDIDRRTILGLRGKEPTEQHINTILDYSLYWLISLEDYYSAYADADFLTLLWPRAVSLLDFVRTRENADGFLCGKAGDWTFIDWSPIDKTGAVCAEQMLYIRALRAMEYVASVIGQDAAPYAAAAAELREKVQKFYWDAEKGAFIDSYASGKRNVTRHANIFALLFDIAAEEQKESIIRNVLLSDSVTKITTPYFEGFELDAMCRIGNFRFFEDMLASYWGGMLALGATTVWEEFDPTKTGAEHYAMYGHRFSKSLCHAWGATPVYLFGKYYLGVTATAPGGASFTVAPQLGGLEWMEGSVPVGGGEVRVRMTRAELSVTATVAGGTLLWKGESYPLAPDQPCTIAL